MRKILIFTILLIILVIICGWIFKIVFVAQDGENQNKVFNIKKGSGVNQISAELKEQGLLNNSFIFETYLWLKKSEGDIKAGEHRINDTLSIRQLVNALTSGHSIDENEIKITILEGWNIRDIAAYLEEKELTTVEEFTDVVGLPAFDYSHDTDLTKPKDYSGDYTFLTEKSKDISLEGYLFPDTYFVFKDATIDNIVKVMLNNFERKIDKDILKDIFSQDKKLFEILTLASIIEKEGDTVENKKKVAGVYYNRLKLGMALQADPTANYVTGKTTDRPSFDDIGSDNPYNTYKYPGLPPGPICNPGIDSIQAAIYPTGHDYYYFINTPEGEMIFARNFEEHKQNRIKYFKD